MHACYEKSAQLTLRRCGFLHVCPRGQTRLHPCTDTTRWLLLSEAQSNLGTGRQLAISSISERAVPTRTSQSPHPPQIYFVDHVRARARSRDRRRHGALGSDGSPKGVEGEERLALFDELSTTTRLAWTTTGSHVPAVIPDTGVPRLQENAPP